MHTNTATNDTAPDFAALLTQATTEPGIISECYRRFHQYSLGNQILAWIQLLEREIPIGPIATFQRWKELGRYVRKGEKAIALIQPITCKRRADVSTDTADADAAETFTRFMLRRQWFTLAQTEGAEYQPTPPPDWDRARALAALNVAEIPFETMNGNAQGFARGRSIAINPLAVLPHKTTFHELGHVLLGHTADTDRADDEQPATRSLEEVEAESVAMLCCAALGLPGLAESRGYIQGWNQSGQPIPEANARRIFKAADAILRAGRDDPQAEAA